MTDRKPYERKAVYYETDQMGIIHHSNYIRWFEEARDHWMTEMGMSYEEIEAKGILIPVLSVSCEYKKSVRYNETVLIEVKLTAFKGVKFMAEYRVTNKETGELKVTGTSSHCFVDKELKPIHLKRDYPEVYKMFDEALKHD